MSGFIMWLSGAWVILERAQNEELHYRNYSNHPMLGSMGLYRRITGLEGLTMTENQIEIIVERVIDKLDARLMQSKITQSEYDYEVSIIDKWATQQYEHSKAESV
jgi:hypothetical protein